MALRHREEGRELVKKLLLGSVFLCRSGEMLSL